MKKHLFNCLIIICILIFENAQAQVKYDEGAVYIKGVTLLQDRNMAHLNFYV